MADKSIEELERAGRFALPHSELLDLARNTSLSVKQVRRAAVTRKWPPRQVKAVRALAILRRDHGIQALEAYINRMECARRDEPETEQAQRRTNMEERIRRRLDLLIKPAEKLELLLRHKMRDDIATLVMGLTEAHPTYFKVGVDTGSVKIHFDTIAEVPYIGGWSTERPETIEWAREHRKRICVVWVTKEAAERQPAETIYADLAGLHRYLGWSEEQVADLVRKATTRIVEQGPMPTNWRWVEGVHAASTLVLPEDDELRIEADIWYLQSHFRRGRLFEIRRQVLDIEEKAASEKDELNPLVDRFMALGWTQEQVRAEFLDAIRGFVDSCRPQFMLALVGAKCFKHAWEHGDPEVSAILRPGYLEYLWDTYLAVMHPPQWFLTVFMELGRCGLWESRDRVSYKDHTPVDNDRAFFRRKIAEMVARGEVNKASQLVLFFGDKWKLFYDGAATGQRMTNPSKWFLTVLPEAYKMAKEQNRFGIAAALIQHYGLDGVMPVDGIEAQLAKAFQPKIDEVIKQVWPDDEDIWWDMKYLTCEFTVDDFILGQNEDEELYYDLYHDEYRRDDIPSDVMEAAQALHAKAIELLRTIKQECDAARSDLMRQRSLELREITETALDLGQPIRLDTGCYLLSPVKLSRD